MRSAGTTAEACKRICADDLGCSGIDFDPSNALSHCWLHLDPGYISSLIDTAGVTHYHLETRLCGQYINDLLTSPHVRY